MDKEDFNISIRKLPKMVGVSARREIERAVQPAVTAAARGGPSNGLRLAAGCGSTKPPARATKRREPVPPGFGTPAGGQPIESRRRRPGAIGQLLTLAGADTAQQVTQ